MAETTPSPAATEETPGSGSGEQSHSSKASGKTEKRPSPIAGSALERHSSGGSSLKTEHGTTTIASSVVAKIAGLATQEIPGVQAMGKSLSRTFGTLRAKMPGATQAASQGVSVEVGERQAAVDIDIVVYYGNSIVEVAEAIRDNVIERIETMTSLEVVEVNVSVDDLYLDGAEDESRVE
jgi:uncharacterized alkaline shock family protein YloU